MKEDGVRVAVEGDLPVLIYLPILPSLGVDILNHLHYTI